MATQTQSMNRKPLSKDKLRMYMRAESHAITREAIAALFLLRWIDYSEAEREAIAIFEGTPFNSILPLNFQWRALCRIDYSAADQLAERLSSLSDHLSSQPDSSEPRPAVWLRMLSPVFERLARVNSTYLLHQLQRVGELPFETAIERLEALEAFDSDLNELSDPYHAQYSTPISIARLMAALANPQPGERIYDPCFGSANLLIEANKQSQGKQHSPSRGKHQLDVAGMEINEISLLVGLVRILLAGIEPACVELGNSLVCEPSCSPGSQGFDLVVANPPIGAKVPRDAAWHKHFTFLTADSTGLFIQHALSRLKRHGRAVIAVPEGFLFRGGAERDLRRHLLEQGQVQAVIGLPAGAFAPYTSVKVSLLVLSKQGGTSRVRMVDANPLFDARADGNGNRKAPVIRAEMALQLAQEVLRAELRKPRALPPGVAEGTPGTGVLDRAVWEVSYEELASAEWDLTPRRREQGGLDDLLASLQESMGEKISVVPLKGVAKLMAGRAIKASDLVDELPGDLEQGPVMPYLRIKDLQQGKVARASSWVRPELAYIEERWALLPGDVLLSKSGTIGKSAVVNNGAVGAIAASGLYVLRADQERLDPAFLMAYLASPNSQSWLAARARGAVIQHLNRGVLDELPVLLPPLHLQARAATQFRDHGTDALTFLLQAFRGKEADRLTAWLAEFDGKLPRFVTGLDDTPALTHLEPLVALAMTARPWLDQEQVSSQSARWLKPLCRALVPLAGVAQMPLGLGLVTVLQEGQSSLREALEQSGGHSAAESQARALIERLRDWLRATTRDLFDIAGVSVREAPSSLTRGSYAEFTVTLENPAVLPLRNVRVRTEPHWGSAEFSYVPEGGNFPLRLRGDVPKRGNVVTLLVLVEAHTLTGEVINGKIELPIRVVDEGQTAVSEIAELSGSPYVVGDPLSPKHGHSAFFGREDLIKKISRQIAAQGNVVLLEGNRRAGKTSILRHMEGQAVIPGWLTVYSALTGAEGDQRSTGTPTPEVFRALAHSIATALCKLAIDVPLPDGQVIGADQRKLGLARLITAACKIGIDTESPFADFRDYLDAVLQALEPLGLGLVLMLDEFDKLQEGIENGVTSKQVPDNIRYLIQSYPRFSAILTGTLRLKSLREEYWSALFGLGTTIQVSALDPDSARKVVTEPVRNQLAFSEEAVDRVLTITARHPYLMQCLCNCIFEFAAQTRSRSITANAVDDAAVYLARSFEYCTWLWDDPQGPQAGRYRRQFILMVFARGFKDGSHIDFGTLGEQLAQAGVEVNDAALDADLSYLRERELVSFLGESGGGEYRLAIPLMTEWITQHQDADAVAGRARAEAEEKNA